MSDGGQFLLVRDGLQKSSWSAQVVRFAFMHRWSLGDVRKDLMDGKSPLLLSLVRRFEGRIYGKDVLRIFYE